MRREAANLELRPLSRATLVIHFLQEVLLLFSLAFFALALVMDVAYWSTANLTWKVFAEWLLLAGIGHGALAAIAGAVEVFGRRNIRERWSAWPFALGYVAMLAVAFLDNLVHAHDGWSGVVPLGLILSAATAVLTALIAVMVLGISGVLMRRHDAHVTDMQGASHG